MVKDKSRGMANGVEKLQPAYFKSLTIEDVNCFKGEHTIDFSDSRGKPAQWTVILGNNNTGKTTLLKCLAGLGVINSPLYSNINDPKEESFPYLALYVNFPIIEFGCIIGQYFLANNNFTSIKKSEFNIFPKEGGYWGSDRGSFMSTPLGEIDGALIYCYGASRKMSAYGPSNGEEKFPYFNLFNFEDLPNMEDWLLKLTLSGQFEKEALDIFELVKKVLCSGLLPDVQDLNVTSRKEGSSFEPFVEFKTDFGWVRLKDLGYGYQTMIAWVLDLVKRMVERYTHAENPLAEPAIVLVDEIDLHLHPDWQRKIIAHLSKYFPNTQFIVTAHSPLVVQSAEEVNVVILRKEKESVRIDQPQIRSFRGWTVEEILTDLMDLEGQTMSQTYLDLMEQFDRALDQDNYEQAKEAYDKLDKILHPGSHHRKLLQLQMTSLSPAETL